MRLLAGTSGFSFKEWKGSFYPEDLKNEDMLRFYSERLPAVEINNTFYRMPRPNIVATWARQSTDGFLFAVKASRRITHRARLKDTEETLGFLWNGLAELGPKLGCVLFQLPPTFKKDVERLRDFVALLPQDVRVVFEFRHPSWTADDEARDVLRSRNLALCVNDKEDEDTALESTADFGYLRLHRPSYERRELEKWAERIREQSWKDAFVFFKHEDDGAGPAVAAQMLEVFAQG